MPDFIMTGLNLIAAGVLYGIGGTIGVLLVLRCVNFRVNVNWGAGIEKGTEQ